MLIFEPEASVPHDALGGSVSVGHGWCFWPDVDPDDHLPKADYGPTQYRFGQALIKEGTIDGSDWFDCLMV